MDSKVLFNQFGGISGLKAVVNAMGFIEDQDNLQFRFSGNEEINRVSFRLNAMDTYDLTFYKDSDVVKIIEDTYCDNLKEVFESNTGLMLSVC